MPPPAANPQVIGAGVLILAILVGIMVERESIIGAIVRIPMDLAKGTASFGVTIVRTIVLSVAASVTAYAAWQAMGALSYKLGLKDEEDRPKLKRSRTQMGYGAGDTPDTPTARDDGSSGFAPGRDSTQWINEILAAVWPMITKYLESNLKESIEKSIQAAVPLGGSSIYFKDIGVGTIPMRFENMHTRNLKRQYVGGSQTMLQLSMDLVYEGDAKIVLSAFGAKIGISNFCLKGPLVIDFPQLLPVPPFFSGMSFYFPTKPQVSMDWEGLAAVASDPMFAAKVQNVIETQVSSRLVLPNRIGKLMAARDQAEKYRVLKPRPAGVLQIRVKSAKNLKAADTSLVSMGKLVSSDPFVVVEVGAASWQTSTIKKSLNPVWEDEVHNFFVQYPKLQAVKFEVNDEDRFTGADPLGKCAVTVEEMVARDSTVPLVLVDGDGDGKNTCKSLGSTLTVEALYMPLILDSAMCKEIKSGSKEATCMLFVGVNSALGLPAAEAGTSHWCEVTVEEPGRPALNWSTIHVVVEKAGEAEEEHKKKKMQKKIKKLTDAKVPKSVINEVLEINEEADVEECVDITAQWDDGLFHLLNDPTKAKLTMVVKTDSLPNGKVNKKKEPRVLGKAVSYQVSDLMNQSDNTLLDHSLYFADEEETVLKLFLQLRAVGKPTLDLNPVAATKTFVEQPAASPQATEEATGNDGWEEEY